MKHDKFLLFSLLILVIASLSGVAKAQGCGQISIDEGEIHCCDNTETQEDHSCGGSGNPYYYCSEGSGECCGTHYATTNVTYDPDECGCSSGGCCQNITQCTQDGSGQVCDTCSCQCVPGSSPIIVDTTGKGFHLTSAQAGVEFDIRGDGRPIQIAWTTADSGDAFLALDRNHNGRIDNGKELFGNYTEQPKSEHPNGFLALAEFDKPENGGNGDGIIDDRDAVFSHLLLWIDENHDGISQPTELHTLPELGVYSISLHYRNDRFFFDQYGNWFHYQAALNPDPHDGMSKDGRVTYDVFFVMAQNRLPRGDMPSEGLLLDGLDSGIYRAARVRGGSPCKRNLSGGGQ